MGKINQILGDNIRTNRVSKGWTQVYLADRLEITAPFIAQIESGKRGVSLELVEKIADVFEIPVSSLFIENCDYNNISTTIKQLKYNTIQKQLTEKIINNIQEAFDNMR